jgi:hypothetical protein
MGQVSARVFGSPLALSGGRRGSRSLLVLPLDGLRPTPLVLNGFHILAHRRDSLHLQLPDTLH